MIPQGDGRRCATREKKARSRPPDGSETRAQPLRGSGGAFPTMAEKTAKVDFHAKHSQHRGDPSARHAAPPSPRAHRPPSGGERGRPARAAWRAQRRRARGRAADHRVEPAALPLRGRRRRRLRARAQRGRPGHGPGPLARAGRQPLDRLGRRGCGHGRRRARPAGRGVRRARLPRGVLGRPRRRSLLRGLLQLGHLAAVPRVPPVHTLQRRRMGGLPARERTVLRGSAGRSAPRRHAVDPGLPPHAASVDAARGAAGCVHRVLPAHPLPRLRDVPHAAVARRDRPRRAGSRPHRLPCLRLRAPFPVQLPARGGHREHERHAHG